MTVAVGVRQEGHVEILVLTALRDVLSRGASKWV